MCVQKGVVGPAEILTAKKKGRLKIANKQWISIVEMVLLECETRKLRINIKKPCNSSKSCMLVSTHTHVMRPSLACCISIYSVHVVCGGLSTRNVCNSTIMASNYKGRIIMELFRMGLTRKPFHVPGKYVCINVAFM